MITAASTATGQSGVTIPLGVLISVLGFGLTGMSGFLAWLVKQVTLQSRFQAETSIVLKGISDRASEDRQKIERLEERMRNQPIPRRSNYNRREDHNFIAV